MQRTVKGTRFIYAKTEMNENGEIAVSKASIEIPETDEKKALKKAVKVVGMFNPLKVETYEETYYLDDEVFFKHATKEKPTKNGKETTEGETAENTEG